MLSKIRNASSVRNSSATRIAGLISGRMTLMSRFHAPAPSTWAALSRSCGTSANPASSSSAMNGVVFHTSASTTIASDGICSVSGRFLRQQVRQIAGARCPRVIPAVRRGDRDDSVRDEDRGAHDALAEDGAVHHQCQRHAEHELDGDRDDGDGKGDGKRGPPILVAEDGDVVGQADELGVLRRRHVVALQAQPDRVADRIGGDREHQQHRGSDQKERQPALRAGVLAAGRGRSRGGLRCRGHRWRGHGISPLPSMAFCTCSVSSSAVCSGSMSVIGASVAEIRVDTAW